jgi:polyphosphate kinase 2 (PPK2 family)
MLERIDLTRKLQPEVYKQAYPRLEQRLNALQREAHEAGVPVVIVFEGWDAAGKGTCINRLMQPLDPRGFKVHAISAPTQDESYRPFLWRFWTRLPARGRVAIFDRSWYGRVLVERVDKLVPRAECERSYKEIVDFERTLADDGYVVVKFWLHISQKEQKRRFKAIAADPAESWKVKKEDWHRHKQYDKYLKAAEAMLERTSTAHAPWTIVEAHDGRFARTKIFETVIDAVERALAHKRAATPKVRPAASTAPARKGTSSLTRGDDILARLDLGQAMDRQEYDEVLPRLQQRVRDLEHRIYGARVPVVILYEGCDAAGKGGNIKRLTQSLDPRGFEVIPVAAPTDEEKIRHYLWRFWRALPKAGHMTIFDRTWYGRVLVERIEGFCSEEEWRRAYQEINEFEAQLASYGSVVVKFWLQIDKDEQLRRFKERQDTEHKQWKITEEDWRNRKKWDLYQQAVADMVQKTSTSYAPWTLVEANNKEFARVKALATVVHAIEDRLGMPRTRLKPRLPKVPPPKPSPAGKTRK